MFIDPKEAVKHDSAAGDQSSIEHQPCFSKINKIDECESEQLRKTRRAIQVRP